LTPPCLTFEPPATAAPFFVVPFRVNAAAAHADAATPNTDRRKLFAVRAPKTWRHGNYVCKLSVRALDKKAAKGNAGGLAGVGARPRKFL